MDLYRFVPRLEEIEGRFTPDAAAPTGALAAIIAAPVAASIGTTSAGTSTLPALAGVFPGSSAIGGSAAGFTAFGALPVGYLAVPTPDNTQSGPNDLFTLIGTGTGTGGTGIGTTPSVPPGSPPSTILEGGSSASGTNGTTG